MKFEPLDSKKHNRQNFDCGVEALNLYLKNFAGQDQRRSLSRVYVLSDHDTIIGYYSISAHSVSRDNLPDEARIGNYHDIPFILLGRLAVDKHYQGQGFGDALIYHAFTTTLEAADIVGIVGMVVDAKDAKASRFYKGFGFKPLKASKNRLVLALQIIRKLVSRKRTKGDS